MPEGAHVFERFLDEMALLLDALFERLSAAESATDGDVRLAYLHDVSRLSRALTELAIAFNVTDIASLSEAIADASSARIASGKQSPVVILGARDTITYLRRRLAEVRRTGSIIPLDHTAFNMTKALIAALLYEIPGHATPSNVASDADGELDGLSPEEREIVESFATAELRPRDEQLDTQIVGAALTAQPSDEEQWDGVNFFVNGDERLLLEEKRSFVSETENDLQELSALIASYVRDTESRAQLPVMARLAHKIKGTAALIGFPELSQLASYLERWAVFAQQRTEVASEDEIGVILSRFLELFDICLAAATAKESPDPIIVEEAQQLYETATHSLNSASLAKDRAVPNFTQGTAGRLNFAHNLDASALTGHETLLQVYSSRLDALMIHLSALSVNRGSLSAAHARVSHAQSDMANTIARLQEKSAHIIEAFPLGNDVPSSMMSVTDYGSEHSDDHVAFGTRTPSGQLREWRSQGDEGRRFEVDTALRALVEVVADVEMLSTALSGALMQMDQLIEAQEIVISNIQQDATRMRLAPLSDLAPRLEMLAKYLAPALGKRVRFTIEGDMTEIDRTLMLALGEPLNQLVRNAITHGIELPEERIAAGKPVTGEVWIHAYYAGSEVVIEVGDDGRGVNTHALVERAIKNGVLEELEGHTLSRDAALDLMFQTGVSTLDRPNALAGSGIGLDEVATIIREIKGEIVVADTSSQGTLFRIRAPMTLTVLPALDISIGGQVFTAPFSSVVLSLGDITGNLRRISPNQDNDSREAVAPKVTTYRLMLPSEAEPLRTEGGLPGARLLPGFELPAFSLAECFGLAYDEPPHAAIVVVRRNRYVALLVDAIGAMRETMVRSLPSYLKRKHIRGVTIRAEDGEMALLIDIGELVDHLIAGSVTSSRHVLSRPVRPEPAAQVLIVDDSVTIRRALDQILTGAGFATAQARDGYDALEKMEIELPRVVILDIEMPRLGGYELLEIMRNSPKYTKTRVIMLTSRAGAQHEQHARALGADEYFVKPCPEDTLIGAVRRLLTDSGSS